jgi:diaminopimelate decarboxylase
LLKSGITPLPFILNRLAGLVRMIPPKMDESRLRRFVSSCLLHREIFIRLALKHGSPLYALDEKRLRMQVHRFRRAFEERLGPVGIFFAMKSNNLPEITRIMVEEGIGLDVSSGAELTQALNAGAEEIFFSGPGKTNEELTAAIGQADRVTILMDSFGELERLDHLTRHHQRAVRAGIRLATDHSGLWRKFGIPLSSLRDFLHKAREAPFIHLAGLQFHTSWNLSPSAQVTFIARLGSVLRDLPERLIDQVTFVDIGGGFWPEEGEWLRTGGTRFGMIMNLLFPRHRDNQSRFLIASRSIDVFAHRISTALRAALPGHLHCRICLEPGRWLSHGAMHLLITVVDVKGRDLVITDAGTNAVGWERFEQDYFPVINLTRPGIEEHACAVLGSLCTPHDVWGYSYHGTEIRPGDLLLIPAQGAYTYSLRQNFIKPLPAIAVLPEKVGPDWPRHGSAETKGQSDTSMPDRSLLP